MLVRASGSYLLLFKDTRVSKERAGGSHQQRNYNIPNLLLGQNYIVILSKTLWF